MGYVIFHVVSKVIAFPRELEDLWDITLALSIIFDFGGFYRIILKVILPVLENIANIRLVTDLILINYFMIHYFF